LEVKRSPVQSGKFSVEGDATAATYFAALATLHQGEITLANLGANTMQGDYAFCDIMAELGATVTKGESTTIHGPKQLGALPCIDMTKMPDAALTLIAMAPLLPSVTTLSGLSSLHHKECDRLECSAAELRALGVEVVTSPDSITITPLAPTDMRRHTLKTYHDHRMAMAFSLIGSKSETLSVDDKSVVEKTYPDYWEDYAALSA
jgi:3-phosphoshikimate 1-carboxyvinyltransferase